MNDRAKSAFLNLPAELRLQVYNYAIPGIPLSQPRSHYNGLITACRQTRVEVEALILERMRQTLSGIAEESLGKFRDIILFTIPQTLQELSNLSIEMRVAWRVVGNSWDERWTRHPVLGLLDLRLNLLTIKISCNHDENDAAEHEVHLRWMLARFMSTEPEQHVPRINKLNLNWVAASPLYGCPWARFRRDFMGFDDIRNITRDHVWQYTVSKYQARLPLAIRLERLRNSGSSASQAGQGLVSNIHSTTSQKVRSFLSRLRTARRGQTTRPDFEHRNIFETTWRACASRLTRLMTIPRNNHSKNTIRPVSAYFAQSYTNYFPYHEASMGQCGSKQDYYEPSGPPPMTGDSKYDQYAQEQYNRERYAREQQRAAKKKRSKMNGIVAAAAGAA
ncbi:hypothetical protein BKA63DRAFT_488357 [Paraphoma chrysanthemicola]|nr:hypothetical protein BKA63DRAFT_488357 [Paraphoma chrysanthemicola]